MVDPSLLLGTTVLYRRLARMQRAGEKHVSDVEERAVAIVTWAEPGGEGETMPRVRLLVMFPGGEPFPTGPVSWKHASEPLVPLTEGELGELRAANIAPAWAQSWCYLRGTRAEIDATPRTSQAEVISE